MKGFDPQLAQHTMELEPTAKLVRQKQRPINPRIEPLMQKEVFRLIESKIIICWNFILTDLNDMEVIVGIQWMEILDE